MAKLPHQQSLAVVDDPDVVTKLYGDANYGAAVGTTVYFDELITASPVTVVLPASPTTGEVRNYCDVNGNADGTNFLRLDGNGKTINGAANFTMTSAYDAVTIRYDGTEWHIR